MTRDEVVKAGLTKVVPHRVLARGNYPTRSTKELTTRTYEGPTKFLEGRRQPTEMEERMLIALVVKIGVLMVIRNHIYRWSGDEWMQSLGVPMGLALSGIIGRITMDVWMSRMSELLKDNQIRTYLFKKYVYDSNTLLETQLLRTRWVGGSMVVTPRS